MGKNLLEKSFEQLDCRLISCGSTIGCGILLQLLYHCGLSVPIPFQNIDHQMVHRVLRLIMLEGTTAHKRLLPVELLVIYLTFIKGFLVLYPNVSGPLGSLCWVPTSSFFFH